jgi:hypothetical protein
MIAALTAAFCGCSVQKPLNDTPMVTHAPSHMAGAPVRTAPGVVEYVWEEPMIDVIEVPPGLDPDGVYYRPAHQEIVEIRQGRWKYYRADTQ